MELLNHPAVQGGVAPLAVALVIATLLARTHFAWLAIVGGYATMIALTTGFQFSPLTASRKILLLGLIVPVVGVAADLIPRPSRAIAAAFALAAGLASIWALASVLRQQEGSAPYVAAAGIAVFGFVLTALVLGLRDDGLRTGAAGLGLGLATGVAAVPSPPHGMPRAARSADVQVEGEYDVEAPRHPVARGPAGRSHRGAGILYA